MANPGYSNPQPVIANGASLSGAFYIGHGRLDSIQMPAAWDAASLTFQGSIDGTNFFNIFDNTGTEVTITAAANDLIPMGSPGYFEGALWMKVRSGTNGAPVNQTAARTLSLLVRKFPIHPGR